MSRHLNILAFLIGFARVMIAHPLDNWHLQNTNLSFGAVTYGKGLLVGVGMPGTAVVSSDGVSWAGHPLVANGHLVDITFGGGLFVAVGRLGAIVTSPDGTNWVQQTSGTEVWLSSVAHGPAGFVIRSEAAMVLTSADGTNWFQHATPAWVPFSVIIQGNGCYVFPGGRGTNYVSTDGTNWSARSSGTDMGLEALGFGGGLFMSIDIRQRVFTSSDASNWVQRGSIAFIRPNQITYGNGLFLVNGNYQSEYSRDGVSWTTITNTCCGKSTFGKGFFVTRDGEGIKKSDPIVTLQMDGPSSLRFLGPTGAVVNVESSSLASGDSWQPVTNLLLPTNPYLWTAPILSNSPSRFYRALVVP